MKCTCYITDLLNNKSFFDNIKFKNYHDIDNYIALMLENDFRIDRIVLNDDTIIYDILE